RRRGAGTRRSPRRAAGTVRQPARPRARRADARRRGAQRTTLGLRGHGRGRRGRARAPAPPPGPWRRIMMRLDSFARSALFAAGAAALWPAFAMTAAPFVGWRPALAIYLAGVTTLYVTGLGAAGGPRHRAIALTAGAAVAFAAFAHTTAELAVALAAVLGCVRSALLYRTRPARAVATEVALLAGGLMFAGFLAGPSVLSIAVALWGFFLVQRLFFLVARPKP